MKKIYKVLLTALIATGSLASCSDYDAPEVNNESAVKIISHETSFQAAPSQGTVVVESASPVTVTCDGNWVTTSVNGNTINVSVTQNSSIDGRSAMLKLTNSEGTTQLAVIQSGIVIQLEGGNTKTYNDNARTVTFNLKTNVPMEISSDVNWITPTMEDGVITAELAANNAGYVRTGHIIISTEGYEDTIAITQGDFTKDIAGTYLLLFIDPDDGKTYYLASSVRRSGSSYSIDLPSLGLSIPVTYSSADLTLTMAGGAYMGDYGPYKVHTVFWDTNLGYITWSSSVSMTTTPWEYVEEEDASGPYGTISAQFVDNGSWSGYTPDALILEAFNATPATSTGRLGDLISLIYPTLYRDFDIETPAAAQANAAAIAKSYAANPKAKRFAKARSMAKEAKTKSLQAFESDLKVAE